MNYALNHIKHKANHFLLVSSPHPISGIRHLKLQEDAITDEFEQSYFQFKLDKNRQDHEFWLQRNSNYRQKLNHSRKNPEFNRNFVEQSDQEMNRYNRKHWNDLITELKYGIPVEIQVVKKRLQYVFKERNLFKLWFLAGLVVPLYFID